MCFAPDPNSPSPPSAPAMDGPETLLLEHAACDDPEALARAADEARLPLDTPAPWYGRWWSHGNLRPVRFEDRTPLMVAALYGSAAVVRQLVAADPAAVNRRCGSDAATALHCAAAGGSASAMHVIRLLLAAGADVGAEDAGGRRAVEVLPRQRSRPALEALLRGGAVAEDAGEEEEVAVAAAERKERKEYPVDATLPDIKSGVYGTDEFRMYTFKVKPCSRAYSHDWTECPFVHPGENARRRDPRKYHYSCVPCPDFRKGACRAGDACEYAHGVFESWLHPAQYRTRLCKDEVGCTRRVCFFAHKPEELRPLYPSSPGSLVSSPRAAAASLGLPPLDLGAALLLNQQQQQPMSPSTSAAMAWLSQAGGIVATPTAQLPSSRLMSGVTARDVDLEMMGFDGYGQQLLKQQQLMDEIASISPPASWASSTLAPIAGDYADLFGYLDGSPLLSPMKGLSLKPNGGSPQLQKQQQQLLFGGGNLPTSPSAHSSSSLATTLMNARTSAFAKRSQSFIDRGARLSNLAVAPPVSMLPPLSGWGSPDGRLDWAIQGEELSKLRKSASFALRGSNPTVAALPEEPDVSWVHSLVRDGSQVEASKFHLNSGAGEFRPGGDKLSAWADQLLFDQEQIVA